MKRVMFWGLAAVLAFLNVRSSAQDNKDSAGWTLRKPIIDQSDSAHDDDGGIDRSLEHTNGRGRYSPLDAQVLPIQPTRSIDFSTDDGSNMDVDVSPDGSTLLFDILGDLYTVPTAGGEATQITRGMAINRQPVWSPDGTRIAYISDFSGTSHLNVRDISGKLHLVLGPSDVQIRNYIRSWPEWMGDGNFIALDDNIYGLAGGISPMTSIRTPVRFSADGQSVFYIDSASLIRQDLRRNIRTKLASGIKGFESGTLSPDAHWWVYVTDSNSKKCLVAKDLINNNERVLVPSLVFKWCLYYMPINARYAFSPDSKSVFIGYGGKIHRIDVESGANKIVPFTANVKVDLGPLDYNTFRIPHDSLKVRYTRYTNASPDGKHLVFSALDQLYVMDLPNGKPHMLARQSINQFQPVYSPDGKWIAYVSWCDTVGGFLWRVPASGGRPEQLTHLAGQYQQPAWSSDGKLIAVVRGAPKLSAMDDPGQGELEVIPLKGGAVRIIDDTVPLWNHLAFSSDGNRVMYQPRRMGGNDDLDPILVSKDLDGNDLRILAVWKSEELDQAWVKQRSISPDGRFFVYSAGEDLYLVPICNLIRPVIVSDSKQNVAAFRFARGLDPFWEKGGKILSWSYGNQFCRIDPDKIITAAQERRALGLKDGSFISVTVKFDQVISLNVTIPSSYAHGQLALRNVRIITMKGNKVIEHGTIVIKNGRFVAVGPLNMVNVPKGTKIIDLPDATVMPGFVDLHLHMSKPPDIFPQQSWSYLVNIAYGVTTARDPRTNVDDFGYEELLAAGCMIGPRLYPSGVCVNLDGLSDISRIDNLDDARRIVQKRAALGGTFIKQYLLPTRLQKQWLLIAAREAGMNITNEGDFSPLVDVTMMKDGSTGIEHNPVWGDVYKDMTTFVARSGTYFTPTLQVHKGGGNDLLQYLNYLYWRGPNPKLARFMSDAKRKEIEQSPPVDTTDPCYLYPVMVDAQIRKRDGLVTLGSHGNNEGIGVHNELWALQMGGLTNMEALQAGTIMAAQAIGIQKDVGSIEVGKIADLIVLNKNPLEDIHNSREIRYVMKDGILYDGDTLDEIWPVAKKCPEWRLKSTSGN